jgi:hypothetical protein
MAGIWIILIVYFCISIYYTVFVIKSNFDNRRKKLNVILIWIIPLLWGLLLKSILKPLSSKEKKSDKSNYYESGIGLTGE